MVPSVPAAGSPLAPFDGASDADYRRLFELSLDLLCVAGLDGYFKLVNPSWTRVLGWTEAELLARPVAEFMHPQDRERTLKARAALARGVPVRGLENRYLCKDGSYRWLSWQSAIELGSQRVYAVARDVTERRFRDNEKLMISRFESTGVLAAGVAHDFNNLLTSILLSLDMVENQDIGEEVRQSFLAQARGAVLSARALTQRLVIFAEGAAGSRQAADLGGLVRDAAELALQRAELKVEYAIDPSLHRVEVDALQMTQVFSGLVMNAREASPAGGRIRIEAKNVELGANEAREHRPGPYVRVRIADEGPGISDEILPKVFDPYFSTKPRGARKGLGLGLTICRSIVQGHGGWLQIDSQAGRGTSVSCYLPAQSGAEPSAAL